MENKGKSSKAKEGEPLFFFVSRGSAWEMPIYNVKSSHHKNLNFNY
jgi:hypothetical protein